jgi:hypothetical protein
MRRREASSRDLELIATAVARLRAGIMALVFAFCGGIGLFLATVWLLVRGGRNVGLHLGLLANYFPGYRVSWAGSLIGLVYGALVGGVVGYCLAWIYNRLARPRAGPGPASPDGGSESGQGGSRGTAA